MVMRRVQANYLAVAPTMSSRTAGRRKEPSKELQVLDACDVGQQFTSPHLKEVADDPLRMFAIVTCHACL
jgi:hypothetical protein